MMLDGKSKDKAPKRVQAAVDQVAKEQGGTSNQGQKKIPRGGDRSDITKVSKEEERF